MCVSKCSHDSVCVPHPVRCVQASLVAKFCWMAAQKWLYDAYRRILPCCIGEVSGCMETLVMISCLTVSNRLCSTCWVKCHSVSAGSFFLSRNVCLCVIPASHSPHILQIWNIYLVFSTTLNCSWLQLLNYVFIQRDGGHFDLFFFFFLDHLDQTATIKMYETAG